MRLVDLELDLEVFAGPFDLLLTLILREEIDLLEVDLAEIVVSYIDYLEAKGELDLELATEFLVLIAALLELKSRLMLPAQENIDELLELDPGEAAQELLERLLDAHRYRGAAEHLSGLLAEQSGYRFRSAPLPEHIRKATVPRTDAVYDPARLGKALGSLLTLPEEVEVGHLPQVKISVAERLAHVRTLLKRGSFNFEEAIPRADRVTVAVTVFALLELYKQGELVWDQTEPFGEITVRRCESRTSAWA
ncbi:MAG: segregation/condensation protein A [Solirubrobacterales bacterium]|nr:segregation/condensation protein A [Solirubrobacterales bacterium]